MLPSLIMRGRLPAPRRHTLNDTSMTLKYCLFILTNESNGGIDLVLHMDRAAIIREKQLLSISKPGIVELQSNFERNEPPSRTHLLHAFLCLLQKRIVICSAMHRLS